MKYNTRSDGKGKNIIIAVLSVLLVFCLICLINTVDVHYEPVVDAVSENTALKERVYELEAENKDLKNQLANKELASTLTPSPYPQEPIENKVEEELN